MWVCVCGCGSDDDKKMMSTSDRATTKHDHHHHRHHGSADVVGRVCFEQAVFLRSKSCAYHACNFCGFHLNLYTHIEDGIICAHVVGFVVVCVMRSEQWNT